MCMRIFSGRKSVATMRGRSGWLSIDGLYPESLTRRRRAVSPEYYIAQGKESYLIVAEMDRSKPTESLFRKLSAHFEYCVTALNIERTVLQDPFYQYLWRQDV